MLNNIHFVALHVLMCTLPSYAISSQGLLVKCDAIQMLFNWFSFEFSEPHIRQFNQSTLPLKATMLQCSKTCFSPGKNKKF